MLKNALLLTVLLATPAWAAGVPAASAFARHAELKMAGDTAIYTLDLPADVYRYTTRSDLGDLRVLNGAGEPVPYALSSLPAVNEVRQAPLAVPYFPLPQALADAGDVSVTVKATTDGALVAVQQHGDAKAAGATQYFIIDASHIKRPLDTLTLDWTETGFQGRVQVEVSDDLRQWALLTSADVLRLQRNGQLLDARGIDLGGVRTRYLKLRWLTPSPTLQGVSVTPGATQVETRRVWFDATPTGVDAASGEYRFTSPAAAAIDRVRITLPQTNTLVAASLLARNDGSDKWREVARTQLYRLQRADGETVSGPLAIWPTARREWLLRVDTRGGGLGQGQAGVQLGWLPQKLTFVARGTPPFTLAYGLRGLDSAAQPSGALQIGETKPAPAEVGAIQDGTPQPEPLFAPEQLRRWALWGVLLAAVLVLGLIAWRLGKALPAAENDGH
ncbi:hypothetical protein IGB42_03742 [Andreprevotia sp. IGB-42]|uniref:DUF3999 domain-containing protein n=1 Tax=Andreprevotia sp. IGB-42 TaxID=2497473 RepID=UPI001359AB0C|nr:DUF3999 domain-containing protein [Andreprevotia sp. IGB-42]KAF0811725.1 hypothetical protein IGB42_03742 [Andreprevotia sp. IGB-42]